MPNIKSAKKRVLVNKTKAAQNKAAKSALKTDIKKFEAAVVEGNRSEAEGAYKVAVKAVDKAVGHGLLHKNNAARKKSAMTIKLNKLAADRIKAKKPLTDKQILKQAEKLAELDILLGQIWEL